MAATAGRTYADAEAAIWTTISSGAALDAAAMRRGRVIQLMQGYARRVGLESAVSEIPVVHIAGTKGKGSTACMVESMLRQSGLKTGEDRVRWSGLG
jgi:folylpolyglutamate synthase